MTVVEYMWIAATVTLFAWVGLRGKGLGIILFLWISAALFYGSPAQAAGTCSGSAGAAGNPAAVSGGKVALWNTKSRGYTGTPFSFQMVVKRGDRITGYSYQTYTYDNARRGYRHSMTTGAVKQGAVIRVRTWCGGKRGADWEGFVRTR